MSNGFAQFTRGALALLIGFGVMILVARISPNGDLAALTTVPRALLAGAISAIIVFFATKKLFKV